MDVQVKLLNDGYKTNVWRKSTNTDLLLNFNAMCLKIWKSGLIIYFLHRAKCICSNCELYLKEMQKLRIIFNKSGYSIGLSIAHLKNLKNNLQQKITVENQKKISFLLSACRILKILHANFQKKLDGLVKRKFNVDINVCYTTFKTGLYFQPKCSTPLT